MHYYSTWILLRRKHGVQVWNVIVLYVRSLFFFPVYWRHADDTYLYSTSYLFFHSCHFVAVTGKQTFSSLLIFWIHIMVVIPSCKINLKYNLILSTQCLQLLLWDAGEKLYPFFYYASTGANRINDLTTVSVHCYTHTHTIHFLTANYCQITYTNQGSLWHQAITAKFHFENCCCSVILQRRIIHHNVHISPAFQTLFYIFLSRC